MLKFFVCRHVSIWGFRNRVCLSICQTVHRLSVCPSVCPYPEKRNHPSFVNISPTIVIDTSMERSSRVLAYSMEPPPLLKKKKIFKMLTLVFLLSCFVNNQCLAYIVHIDWCYHAIYKHSCRFQHISVLTTCTFTFRQICIIEPSFFNPLLHELFFSSVFWDIALDRLLSSADS